jgi:hypothetical protein
LTSIFRLQETLIKEDKAANSNHSVVAAQSLLPEDDDDDEAQADGPSQDGAAGENCTLPSFSYKSLRLFCNM